MWNLVHKWRRNEAKRNDCLIKNKNKSWSTSNTCAAASDDGIFQEDDLVFAPNNHDGFWRTSCIAETRIIDTETGYEADGKEAQHLHDFRILVNTREGPLKSFL